MYLVIITGGIGSGKSALTHMFAQHGACVLDADTIAHELLLSNEKLIVSLTEAFGRQILDTSGQIVPRELARLAFADNTSTGKLNKITHPYIGKELFAHLASIEESSDTLRRVVAVEIPLLSCVPKFASRADEIIAVLADEATKVRRAVARGMSADDVYRRSAQQDSDDTIVRLADTICINNASLEDLCTWTDTWWSMRQPLFEKER